MTSTISKSISILGCGWLGFPLAKKLVSSGYAVKGSTTHETKMNPLINAGIDAFLIRLDKFDEEQMRRFLEADFLILAIPPSTLDMAKLQIILERALESPIKKVVLISSTGIYKDTGTEIGEENLHALDTNTKLFQVEQLVQSFKQLYPITLRMAGLIGYERQPTRFANSSKVKSNPNGRVNMIHRDDAIELITRILESDLSHEIFNCCADEHPTKSEFYTKLSQSAGLPAPVFDSLTEDSFKIIKNQKIKTALNFKFMGLYDGLTA